MSRSAQSDIHLSDGRLAGRIVVVTGAAAGLGEGIARRMSAEGATVVGLDVAPPSEDADAVVSLACDVADPDSVSASIAEVADRFGGVDVVVNNAGLLSGRASLLEATPQELHRYFSVNAVGALLVVQAAFPYLRDSAHRGRIINVASRTFFTGGAGLVGYVASKGALMGMTRVMAREFGEHRICVNAVIPSQVDTPGTRAHSDDDVFRKTMSAQVIQEFVTPDDFAGLVAFLAGPDARMITGQSIVCDGGGLFH
ncbi:SDR family NAD(P)-dependent oxidoreductase [Mycolicibacterium sp.]|uniref:SDR family NAD(P)-dependent oxidoreductase n=1 Tax=Mycolicibacterium sp. TaxID=2320850 RepID=UPI00355E1B41